MNKIDKIQLLFSKMVTIEDNLYKKFLLEKFHGLE